MHGRSYYHDSLGTTSRLSGLIEEPASVTTTIIIRSGEIRLRIDLIRAYFPEQGAIALLEATYYPARFQSSIESCFSSWSLDSFSFRFAPRFRHDWIAQFFFLIPYLLFKNSCYKHLVRHLSSPFFFRGLWARSRGDAYRGMDLKKRIKESQRDLGQKEMSHRRRRF